MLSSKGSSDTCISDGLLTFLQCAFTAHGVADIVDAGNIVLGPIDPDIFLLDKKSVVYAAIRDGHT